MSLEVWIAFVATSIVLLTIPGPTVLLVVTYALGRGKSSAWATVPGVALGDFTAMTASLLGAGAVLAASATAFTVLKLIGAAYLVWLGIKLWRSNPAQGPLEQSAESGSERSLFWHAFIVTALNPKGILFFIAFVPQFIDATAAALPQFALLEATFVTLAALNVAIWAVLAGTLRARFQKPTTLKRVNRVGGSFLIGAGILASAKTI
ncbi:MAG: LysE family translocator [Alphaproteobacteria bacterium]|jgi:threonine/homoserine/homoserine lactone efflux protein|nr:LysE family translocator [Alphaproteobacteria bacterium]MBT4710887.1 LysE family translocator [Alphaproteobacteria bacterium]MBT5860235.1 LysE family translocator [Alphaproteobacteria bacterium]